MKPEVMLASIQLNASHSGPPQLLRMYPEIGRRTQEVLYFQHLRFSVEPNEPNEPRAEPSGSDSIQAFPLRTRSLGRPLQAFLCALCASARNLRPLAYSPPLAGIVEVDKPRIMQSPVLSREEELYWLALKLVPGLGTRTSGKLLERFRTPQAIFRASRTELEGAGVSGAVAQSIASGCTFDDAAAQQEKMAKAAPCWSPSAIRAIRSALREIFDPPDRAVRPRTRRTAAVHLRSAWWARAGPRPTASRWPSGCRATWRTPG